MDIADAHGRGGVEMMDTASFARMHGTCRFDKALLFMNDSAKHTTSRAAWAVSSAQVQAVWDGTRLLCFLALAST